MTDLSQQAMDHDDIVMDNVEEGMTVKDSNGDRVGSVDFIRFGEGHEAISVPNDNTADDQETITDLIVDIFTSESDMPEEVRAKLERHGFARVNGILPGSTHFFIPEQIERVEDETVYLNVTKDELADE